LLEWPIEDAGKEGKRAESNKDDMKYRGSSKNNKLERQNLTFDLSEWLGDIPRNLFGAQKRV
jgi:hypothetical protein